MRYLLLLLLLSSFTVLPTDRELINGTWSFYELKGQDGKVMYSSDKAKQKELIDEMVKDQLEQYPGAGVDEKLLRDMAAKQFEMMGKMTFTFNEKGIAKVETHGDDESRDTESTFTMDEKKKEVMIKSEYSEIKYTYAFDGDKLTMKGETEEFTLVKKN